MRFVACILVAFVALLGNVQCHKLLNLEIGPPGAPLPPPPPPPQPLPPPPPPAQPQQPPAQPPQQPQGESNQNQNQEDQNPKFTLLGIIPQQPLLPNQQEQYTSLTQQLEEQQRLESVKGGNEGRGKTSLQRQPTTITHPGALAYVFIRPLQQQQQQQQLEPLRLPFRQEGATKGGSEQRFRRPRPLKPIRQSEGGSTKGAGNESQQQEERKTRRPLRPLRQNDQSTKGRERYNSRPLYLAPQPSRQQPETKGSRYQQRPLYVHQNEQREEQQQQEEEQQQEEGQEADQQKPIEQEQEQTNQPPPPPPEQAFGYGAGKFLKLKSALEHLKAKFTLGSSYLVTGEEIITQPPPPPPQQPEGQQEQQQEEIPDEQQQQQEQEQEQNEGGEQPPTPDSQPQGEDSGRQQEGKGGQRQEIPPKGQQTADDGFSRRESSKRSFSSTIY